MNDIILTVDNLLPIETENNIVELLKQIDELTAKQEELKAKLKEEMEKRGLVKINSERISITYVQPTTRETFDKKGFKTKYPDLYDEFAGISNVKGYVKVDLNEKNKGKNA